MVLRARTKHLYLIVKYRVLLLRARRRTFVKYLCYDVRNWGDALNRNLIESLSGKPSLGFDVRVRKRYIHQLDPTADTVYLVVGSTIEHADCQTEVWGAGTANPRARFRQEPRRIAAVRGPLTAAWVRDQGVECVDVFGDPALLLPRAFSFEKEKHYRLGIVPHYVDRDSPVVKAAKRDPDVMVIDINRRGIQVLKDISMCEKIASSSLHGLIAAEAYGIPTVWIQITGNVRGGDYKFRDYYQSIGHKAPALYRFSSARQIDELCRSAYVKEIALDLEPLVESCPFPLLDNAKHR